MALGDGGAPCLVVALAQIQERSVDCGICQWFTVADLLAQVFTWGWPQIKREGLERKSSQE